MFSLEKIKSDFIVQYKTPNLKLEKLRPLVQKWQEKKQTCGFLDGNHHRFVVGTFVGVFVFFCFVIVIILFSFVMVFLR